MRRDKNGGNPSPETFCNPITIGAIQSDLEFGGYCAYSSACGSFKTGKNSDYDIPSVIS